MCCGLPALCGRASEGRWHCPDREGACEDNLYLILRSALLRASRRMATGTAEQAAILRDAPLRCGAPQDEVKFFCDREFRRPVGHFRDLKYLKSGGAWSFRVGIR